MRNLILLIIAGFCILFSSCKGKDAQQGNSNVISVTIDPQRYVVEKIAGDKFKVNCVVPFGQSPESYDPTPQEMINISRSKAYFRIGEIGFEQAWMKAICEQNPSMPVYDLSKGINLVKMDAHHHHHHDGECEHHHGSNDPHIWTSVKNMKIIALNVLDAVIELDKENEEYYRSNYKAFADELEKTEAEIDSLLVPLKGKAFIIYHPTLTYLAADYGMTQLCIEIDGKEPSPAQLKELVDTARKNNVKIVFIQKEFDQKNASLIAKETGCKLVSINPLDYDWTKEMKEIAKALANE